MIKSLDVFSLLWAALVGIPVLPFFEFIMFVLPLKITISYGNKAMGKLFFCLEGFLFVSFVCVCVSLGRKENEKEKSILK